MFTINEKEVRYLTRNQLWNQRPVSLCILTQHLPGMFYASASYKGGTAAGSKISLHSHPPWDTPQSCGRIHLRRRRFWAIYLPHQAKLRFGFHCHKQNSEILTHTLLQSSGGRSAKVIDLIFCWVVLYIFVYISLFLCITICYFLSFYKYVFLIPSTKLY